MAVNLYINNQIETDYIDKKSRLSKEEYMQKLRDTTTVYVGNLSMYTSEESIFELFSMCGQIMEVKMGINRKQGTPIGFCFVEFSNREEAQYSVNYLSQTKLDNRVIRVDWDIGFQEGRQFGRGKGGVQWRDVFRKDEDPDRPNIQQQINKPVYDKRNHYQDDSESDQDYRRKKVKKE